MRGKLLSALNKARNERRAAIVVSDLKNATQGLFLEGQEIAQPEIANEAALRFRSGKSGIVEIEGCEMFINAHVPSPRLVIIGAVHISQALAPMAEIAGFDTVIIDPRTAFATSERFPGAQLCADWPDEVLKHRPLDSFTALAALTHDPKIDDLPLIEALGSDCFYVGALGSRKTHAKRCDRLQNAGMSADQIDRIHAPIGLDIAAATPSEIAVAVIAEVIECFRRRGEAPGEAA